MPKLKKLRLSKGLPGVNLYRKDKFAFVFRNIGLTGHQVKTRSAFAHTMRKAAAFADASRIASRIYKLLQPEISAWNPKDCHRRLQAAVLIARDGPQPAPGFLARFQCNPVSFPQPALHWGFPLAYNMTRKEMEAVIPSLHPIKDISAPLGATHVRISLTLKLLNTTTGEKQVFVHNPAVFYRLNRMKTKSIRLRAPLDNRDAVIAIALAGLEFYCSSGDELFTFNNRKNDTMDVIGCVIPPASGGKS